MESRKTDEVAISEWQQTFEVPEDELAAGLGDPLAEVRLGLLAEPNHGHGLSRQEPIDLKKRLTNQENERHPRFGTVPDSFPLPWSTARPEVVELVAQAA